MNWKIYVGFLGLKICDFLLPKNAFYINLGQKKLRAFFTSIFVNKCGKNVNVEKNTYFSHRLEIGDNSGIGLSSKLYGKIIIGNDVMMGPECWIYTQNHETRDCNTLMRLQGPENEKPVVIGNDVWIGGRVTILPGCKIGNGVIIGAGSVVSKDIPDYSVAVGNPVRIVRDRKIVRK